MRKNFFTEKEINYFTDLFKDCRADIFYQPINMKIAETIAEECGDFIKNRKATYEDVFARIGFDLISKQLIEANKNMITNAEKHIKDCTNQITYSVNAIEIMRHDLGERLANKLQLQFYPKASQSMFDIESQCAEKIKEHYEKQGKELMVFTPKLAELLL